MSEKVTDKVLDLVVVIWFVLSLTVGIYAGYSSWQAASVREAQYESVGWKTTNSKIVELGEVNGGFKPVSQTATLEYHYDGELPLQTQQQLGLGYHSGDVVSIYTNNQGEVLVVNSLDARGRVINDPTSNNFWDDYFGSILVALAVTAITAMCLFIVAIGTIFVLVAVEARSHIGSFIKNKLSTTS